VATRRGARDGRRASSRQLSEERKRKSAAAKQRRNEQIGSRRAGKLNRSMRNTYNRASVHQHEAIASVLPRP
jgi:hypothetical protein